MQLLTGVPHRVPGTPAQAYQPLARSRDPRGVREPPLDPVLGNGHRLARLVPRWKEPSPASDDLFIRPRLSDIRVEPQQHVQMIIHHREPTDGHRKDFCKFLEPVFDPLPAVVVSFPQKNARRTQRVTQWYQRVKPRFRPTCKPSRNLRI